MNLDYRKIFKELNKSKIEYLVVGGLAVNFHGIPRMTYDLDLMLLMESDNILKMENLKSEEPDFSKRDPLLDPGKGFYYHVSREQIEEYRTWSYRRRLEWLLAGNRLRQALPRKIIAIQDLFRRGEI